MVRDTLFAPKYTLIGKRDVIRSSGSKIYQVYNVRSVRVNARDEKKDEPSALLGPDHFRPYLATQSSLATSIPRTHDETLLTTYLCHGVPPSASLEIGALERLRYFRITTMDFAPGLKHPRRHI